MSLSPRPTHSPGHLIPSVISAGVGWRQTRYSVVWSALGHKYAGDILLHIYSHLINLTQASVLGLGSRGHVVWSCNFSEGSLLETFR